MYWQKLIKKIAEFEAHFNALLCETNDDTVILFEDECTIRDYMAICATWFLKGKQRKIKTYGQHKGVGLFGVLEYKTGRVLCRPAEELNAQNFQLFIEEKVIPAYADKKIIMILDNGRIHHANVLKDFKEVNAHRITFDFLPPYAPTINRIEGLWKWLKETVIFNRFLRNPYEIAAAVDSFLEYISFRQKDTIRRLCF